MKKHFPKTRRALATLFACGLITLLIPACSNGKKQPSTSSSSSSSSSRAFSTIEKLGEALFSDTNLSKERTQSCATCHNPEAAFTDNRLNANGKTSAFSLGDDGLSLGDRNAPTVAYAHFSPQFGLGSRTRFRSQQPEYVGYLGGQFYDGRANDLAAQAGGPPLNPLEMAMPNKEAVVERLKENSSYVQAFTELFKNVDLSNADATFDAMTAAIAAFEKTAVFNAFDSKYDKSLRGEYIYDPLSKAAEGKALFFSQQFSNCATCHLLQPNSHPKETFSSYEYHNIGVPPNAAERALATKDLDFVDEGLQAHPDLREQADLRGKFKVPTLRNVAVTGPYMHNGAFMKLRTVIEFYDHYLEGSEHTINPESGEPWAEPEVAENISETELKDGRKMTSAEVDALVCFLNTLTDARYEHLIDDQGVDCGN